MSAILITLPCTALEAESKAMNDPKTQRAQSSRGKSAAPQNSGKGGGENDATNGRDIDGDSRWGTLNPARACRLLRRYIFESTCLSLCFRGGAMIVRKIETCPECGREHDLRRRRETHAAAAMREALDYCRDTVADLIHHIGHDEDYLEREMKELVAKCNTALAAPPRNCDKYTTGKQVEDACADERGCPGCFREDLSSPCVSCTVSWLLAPAAEEKGETNEQK